MYTTKDIVSISLFANLEPKKQLSREEQIEEINKMTLDEKIKEWKELYKNLGDFDVHGYSTDGIDCVLLVIEDIIDSGNTLSKVLSILNGMNNKSVKLCALLDKPERRVVDVFVDYIGTRVPDEFVVGYGLDYCEIYRNLPYQFLDIYFQL